MTFAGRVALHSQPVPSSDRGGESAAAVRRRRRFAALLLLSVVAVPMVGAADKASAGKVNADKPNTGKVNAGKASADKPNADKASAGKVNKVDYDAVVEHARVLATTPFVEPQRIPDWLLEISYDEWRDIRFRPEKSLWRKADGNFEIQMFHPGLYYDRAVPINVVDAQGVHQVAFSPSDFDYGKNNFGSRVPENLGFAGFRVHYPINKPDYRDEVIVFLGASYLRALGKDLGFGISARGLAIDTALSSGEEFPFFKEFWLVRPASSAKTITILALLDSQRMTGAFELIVTPGEQTTTDVRATFFSRSEIEKIGLAPLTSMFYSGENSLLATTPDYRPEVHDSDGLAVHTGEGEWIWRPIENPPRLRVSAFNAINPGGFGLLQRDRNFDHYQDLETRPERRPSVWVQPTGDWGRGHVELIEIPTHSDTNDNIVAFWVPEIQAQPNSPLSISYRLIWHGEDATRPPAGRVVATRRDNGTREGGQRFVIDFQGEALRKMPASTVIFGNVTVGAGTGEQGEVVDQQVIKNPDIGGWRLIFQMLPRGSGPIELRAFLKLDDQVLTETWSYVIEP